MFKHKLKASGIHLLLSLVIISLAIGLIITFWFPDSLTKVSHFKEITLLMVSIDLVLGPLLTFAVFKPKKKHLNFDLAVIGAFQFSALMYGMFTLYQSHPVYIAFNVDRFTLVSAMDAKPEQVVINDLKVAKYSSPKLVIAKIPEDKKERSDLMLDVMGGAPDIEERPELYHVYEDNISEILDKSLDPDIIFKKGEAKNKFEHFIEKHGKSKEDYAYLPLEGGARDAVWVLDAKTAQPIDVISVNPWALIAQHKASEKLLNEAKETSKN